MNRREFTKPVAVEIVKRAIMPGSAWPNCEECHASCKRFEIHHIRADGLEVDKSAKLAAAEGQLLCIPCHAEKTKAEAPGSIARWREACAAPSDPIPRLPCEACAGTETASASPGRDKVHRHVVMISSAAPLGTPLRNTAPHTATQHLERKPNAQAC
jgi:hypothetical protein